MGHRTLALGMFTLAALCVPSFAQTPATAERLIVLELPEARLRLELPDWHVRSIAQSRALQGEQTTGSASLDRTFSDAIRQLDRSEGVRELTLIRYANRAFTPAISLWVTPSRGGVPTVELLQDGFRQTQGAAIEVIEAPRPLAVAGIAHAALARFRLRGGRRGGPVLQAERRTVQARHGGHLLTLTLTGAIDGPDRCDPLFARVIASITPM